MSTKHRLKSVAPRHRLKRPKVGALALPKLPATLAGIDTTILIVVAGTVVAIAAVVGIVLALYYTGRLTSRYVHIIQHVDPVTAHRERVVFEYLNIHCMVCSDR